MDKKQIQERLKSSLEFQVLWRDFVISAVILIPLTLLLALRRRVFDDACWPMFFLPVGIILVPYLLFCLIRTVNIFRRPEDYFFCKTTLSRPHGAPFLRDRVYFTALVEDPADGSRYAVDTHAIFLTRGIVSPLMEDYTNAAVTVACNRETGMVVVIG